MRKLIVFFVTLVTVGVVGWAVANQQFLKDSYVVRTSDVQPEAATLMSRLDLTSSASFIYEASRPEVQNAEAFNASCANVQREHSIVLGCYTLQRFFIFDVDDERLAGVKEVTAAHELLHAVYERLGTKERTALDTLLLKTADTIEDQRFNDTLAQYQRTEPDQIANELHSILGTEIADLPTELERHYSKYFSNRQQIVEYARSYESTFTSLDEQIQQYDDQLLRLKEQKDELESELEALRMQVESDQKQLESLRSGGDVESYNQAVPGFNALVRTYNVDVARLRQVVEDYNALVETRNSLATTQSDLVQELNSNVQTLQ